MESFFGTLKAEQVHDRRVTSWAVARCDIFDYIEVCYKRVHCHSALDYVSPAEFEVTQLTQLAVH